MMWYASRKGLAQGSVKDCGRGWNVVSGWWRRLLRARYMSVKKEDDVGDLPPQKGLLLSPKQAF